MKGSFKKGNAESDDMTFETQVRKFHREAKTHPELRSLSYEEPIIREGVALIKARFGFGKNYEKNFRADTQGAMTKLIREHCSDEIEEGMHGKMELEDGKIVKPYVLITLLQAEKSK